MQGLQVTRLQAAKTLAERPMGAMSQETSNAISVARVVCIFFMTFVHLHFFELPAADTGAMRVIRAVLVDFLGRSSVPLLSVVSGFLIVWSIEKHGAGDILRRRAWMLLLPMVIWNMIWIGLMGPSRQPVTAGGLANDIFALTRSPALIYLAFLRDVFVMSLLAPLLMRAIRQVPFLTMAAVGALYVLNLESVVILRPQIPFFFVIGMMMAILAGRMWRPTRWQARAITAAFFVLATAEVAAVFIPEVSVVTSDRLYDTMLRRPVVAAFAWVFCLGLSGLNIGRWLRQNSDAVFLFFLSHGVIFYAIGVIVARIPLFHDALPYTVAWLVAPFLALAGTVMVRRQAMRRPPLARGVALLEGRI